MNFPKKGLQKSAGRMVVVGALLPGQVKTVGKARRVRRPVPLAGTWPGQVAAHALHSAVGVRAPKRGSRFLNNIFAVNGYLGQVLIRMMICDAYRERHRWGLLRLLARPTVCSGGAIIKALTVQVNALSVRAPPKDIEGSGRQQRRMISRPFNVGKVADTQSFCFADCYPCFPNWLVIPVPFLNIDEINVGGKARTPF